ncbi:amylo-alpha-1,6-glucosidase [Aureibacter tunicatorum]|uniref:Mannosylglycerate hydrolase MGH1-like glycoside hydrolase domain-containing protein n=1 Tax=Aureibacter tunicatorum TaxID=866807 RepID=A0AAE3XPK0_9BACT|nr:trehalase family glycosidase [Aureibacter tunicatorum]MDR6240290.1 hypothetical protein [Aureibacter tunicatorum]BDD05829.1 hypothetical protein AUTU_33120 [Aureibacter tunicatorum]
MKNYLIILAMGAFLCSCVKDDSVGVMSNLHATKDSPIYTTYAAAIERSEFLLDEAYELTFYDEERGADFTTDTGGDIGFAFRKGDHWVYKITDMYSQPVINYSYPDMVKFTYTPFKDIVVTVEMLVQSSRAMILDMAIENASSKDVDLQVFPFIQNNYRAFSSIVYEADAFNFMHEEYPDYWTINNEVPYNDSLMNVFRTYPMPDALGSFNSVWGESIQIPNDIHLNKQQQYQVTGRALKSNEDKERVKLKTPSDRIQLILDGDKDKLLTETSPVWGLAENTFDRSGYIRMELGNLKPVKEGMKYEVKLYCNESKQGGIYTARVEEGKGKRKDIELAEYTGMKAPANAKIEKRGDNVYISWTGNKGDDSYRVYAKSRGEAYYSLVEKGIKANDKILSIKGEDWERFIVTAENKQGDISIHSAELIPVEKVSFEEFVSEGIAGEFEHMAKALAFRYDMKLQPNQPKSVRLLRIVGEKDRSYEELNQQANNLKEEKQDQYLKDNEELFASVKQDFESPDLELLYYSAFNMMRQVFYPADNLTNYNYYVFSREPTWGWGHGGQVFHESIAMLPYAMLDPQSAMESQKVYKERQLENGYISYRSGAYLNEIIEHNGSLTSSAPWYSWLNWEVYQVTKDKKFLEEMYSSSKRFYDFFVAQRDVDQDGLCEWGGHAILESVRDALVAVWDEVAWPSNFEALDLNCMLVMEAKSLEKMCLELGYAEEAEHWRKDYEKRSALINETFWDEENQFYYHVDRDNHTFSHKETNDLKRDEIIAFLPLWAGVASEEQAAALVKHLTDPNKFWRKYGIPSLSAEDSYYNDKGYWNGPVWVQWNYLIVRGLLDYGYEAEAKELTRRVAESMVIQLKDNHNLWEFYSPDNAWGGYHKTYIWAGIINKMIEEAGLTSL